MKRRLAAAIALAAGSNRQDAKGEPVEGWSNVP